MRTAAINGAKLGTAAVSSIASPPAETERSEKREPHKSNSSTSSTNSNPVTNEDDENEIPFNRRRKQPSNPSLRDEPGMEIPACAVRIHTSEVLGRGSFGVVFAATYKARSVAVKCLVGMDTPSACEEFEREARQWFRLKHSCIVPLLGISYFAESREKFLQSVEATPMLVMERMSTSVHTAIYSHDPPALEKRLLWLRQTASAFFYLHHECNPPVLHLDLKPDNILIDSDGNAQLADFGLAQVQTLTKSYTTNHDHTRRHGAYLYAPPESFMKGNKHTTKHDVYSFAMTMYEIVSLQSPFSEEPNRVHAKYWVMQEQRPDRPEGKRIPDPCWELIVACWEQNATLRPDFIQIMESMQNWSAEAVSPIIVEESRPDFWDQLAIATDDTLVTVSPKTPKASTKICNGILGTRYCNNVKQEGLTCHFDCHHREVCAIASNASNPVGDEPGPNETEEISRSQNTVPKRTSSLPENRTLQSQDAAVMDASARDPFIVANNNQNIFPVVQPYSKAAPDELSLADGDYVVLTKVFRDGWAEGVSMREGGPAVFPLLCLGGGVLAVHVVQVYLLWRQANNGPSA
ncbi:Receptor-interacting serine/threonine-protein kinase 4 [Chytriomyces hyalinus]|nr:Receptor-interacting serine/threonine-protein kinase 4 [Chytriomyces hyalinus]